MCLFQLEPLFQGQCEDKFSGKDKRRAMCYQVIAQMFSCIDNGRVRKYDQSFLKVFLSGGGLELILCVGPL